LVKANEALNYVLLCELTFRTALERKESRGFHFREEYPERDDINWLKWIILELKDEKVQLRLESIPIDRYPFRPARFEKHPYPVPFFFGK
jgi:succinate dehydrogenase/fumarate reductase flavoprotein subunit